MTDTQILTLVIGVAFPVLAIVGSIVAVLYSNKRVDDMGHRIDELKIDLIKHMDNGFEHMELLLKLHVAEHHQH